MDLALPKGHFSAYLNNVVFYQEKKLSPIFIVTDNFF
jgi:hypothetical protein